MRTRSLAALTAFAIACSGNGPTPIVTKTSTPTPGSTSTPTTTSRMTSTLGSTPTPTSTPRATASTPTPAPAPDPPIPEELLSLPLRGAGLRSPMPGGYLGGWYGDTGLDIAGRYLPVYAIEAGTLDYSEKGHTLWKGKGDTPFSVRIKLDEPIAYNGHKVTHVYYTHLSVIVTEQAEGSDTRKHVVAGERIADSGIGNGVPHLHIGLLLDNEVEQESWEFILREGDVRKVMGDYANGTLLPMRKKK